MYGFKTHDEYYNYCVISKRLSNIAVPTFALQAVDDAMLKDILASQARLPLINLIINFQNSYLGLP